MHVLHLHLWEWDDDSTSPQVLLVLQWLCLSPSQRRGEQHLTVWVSQGSKGHIDILIVKGRSWLSGLRHTSYSLGTLPLHG